MTRLTWDAMGEKVFETGLDRGVLYLNNTSVGVVWNGLVSVTDKPDGGALDSYYQDGIKYLIRQKSEEFAAQISAYTYPEEFTFCDGTAPIDNGLFTTQQSRIPFGLIYRTLVGNDEEITDLGYKIHVVYNASVLPSDKNYTSVADTIAPLNFSWNIITKPVRVAGLRPLSHFIIDSRDTPPPLLAFVEDIFYGNVEQTSRLPSVEELIAIFRDYAIAELDGGFADSVQDAEADSGFYNSTPQSIIYNAGGVG